MRFLLCRQSGMAAEGWSSLGERGQCTEKGEDGAHEEEEDAARLCKTAKRQDRPRAPSLGLKNKQPSANPRRQPRARWEQVHGCVATLSPNLSGHLLYSNRYPI